MRLCTLVKERQIVVLMKWERGLQNNNDRDDVGDSGLTDKATDPSRIPFELTYRCALD